MKSLTAAEMRKLGEQLDTARKDLWQLYDELGADYESDAAKQFELQLKDEENPDRTYDSWWVKNDRENIWHPTIGGKLPNFGENWPWVITSYEESVQAGVKQAAELLGDTRDATETLATMTGEDLEALASIPSVLGMSNEILASASKFMEDAANWIGECRNNLNGASWQGDGRDAYFDSLSPQKGAFEECQKNTESVIEANTALSDMTADVMEFFLSVRTKQLKTFKATGTVIFTLVNPGNWLDVAEKAFNEADRVQQDHVKEFQEKIEEMAQAAEKYRVIEEAERTVGMTWPAPLSGIGGNWSR